MSFWITPDKKNKSKTVAIVESEKLLFS